MSAHLEGATGQSATLKRDDRGRTSAYEDLAGATGSRTRLRSERLEARSLGAGRTPPRLTVEGVAGRLVDISETGLCAVCENAVGSSSADRVTLSIRVGGIALKSQARVVWRTAQGRSTRVGLSFVGHRVDLRDVARRAALTDLRRSLVRGSVPELARIPSAFRRATEEAVHFVQHYRSGMSRYERSLDPASPEHRERVTELARVALPMVRCDFAAADRQLSEAAEELMDEPEVLAAAKRVTERSITSLLMDAPVCRRAYRKPLGYAGDYQVMQYYYDNDLRGPTAFDQIFHKLIVEHPLSNGVRTRSDYVVGLMERASRCHTNREREPFRIASLGCGPAHEISSFDAPRERAVVWSLLDQEEEALRIAYRNGHDAILERPRDEIRCLNVSFRRLIADPAILPVAEPQDFIYCTGLFDYLRPERAVPLVAALYARLAPGGTLAIANAAGPNRHFWAPEFVLDWRLLYRSESDMEGLAAA